jgi:hypothetical protein
MTLKEKITTTLQETRVPNIDKMLQFMEQYGYFKCRSHSHNNWEGGASQHMWAVYLIAKALRDQRRNEPSIAKYATNQKLAIVCLLHDLCDMHVPSYDNTQNAKHGHHGGKSKWIMENLHVGTKAERMVVRNHMKSSDPWTAGTPEEVEEYNALHSLITKADHQASGTAWNSTRFRQGRTQHHGVYTEDSSYLKAVAMDRSVQSGKYHLYMDENYELREYRNYNRNLIQHLDCGYILSIQKKQILFDGNKDVISAAHDYTKKTSKRLCIVVGANADTPKDKDTRLRRGNKNEQDVLICSNLLSAFYHGEKSQEKGSKRYRFEFTMREEVNEIYRQCKEKNQSLYLPDVKIIREGESCGFPFVEPWTVDVLLVLGGRFDMFVVPANLLLIPD